MPAESLMSRRVAATARAQSSLPVPAQLGMRVARAEVIRDARIRSRGAAMRQSTKYHGASVVRGA